MAAEAAAPVSWVGRRLPVRVEAYAHGGHCVARHEGRVVFVRHAIPGERVVAVVTEGQEDSRYLRADAVQVLEPSPDRVRPPCPHAHPDGCGGCDFQHVAVPAQRQALAGVVAELLHRLGGVEVDVEVEAVPVEGATEGAAEGAADGLGWRTRVRFATGTDGRLGLRKHRSHEVLPVARCPIAHADLPAVTDHAWPGTASVEAVVSSDGDRLVVVEPADSARQAPPRVAPVPVDGVVSRRHGRLSGRGRVSETALGRSWRVSAGGFWQVHPGAPQALADAVLAMLRPRAGESAYDLYAGVGLFSAALASAVGADGRVVAVESDRRAVADARRNLHDLQQVRLVHGRVDRVLRHPPRGPVAPADRADLVVLDPPRVGAKRAVVRAVVGLRPRAVAYVACDPAALARDVATFRELGYELAGLRAFDIFPMTHHVECVALLQPGYS